MKNLTDLPEETEDQVKQKIGCYFSERRRITAFKQLLDARTKEIDKIIENLMDKNASRTLRANGIKPIRLHLS